MLEVPGTASPDCLPRCASSVTDLPTRVESDAERGWLYGSLMFSDAQVRTGTLRVGLLKTPVISRTSPTGHVPT